MYRKAMTNDMTEQGDHYVRVADLLRAVLRDPTKSTIRRYTHDSYGQFWRAVANSGIKVTAVKCKSSGDGGAAAAWAVPFFVARFTVRRLMILNKHDFKDFTLDIIPVFKSMRDEFAAADAERARAAAAAAAVGDDAAAAAAAAVGDAAPRAAPIDDSNVSVKRAFVSHTESVEVRDWKSGAAAAKRKRDEAPTAAAAAVGDDAAAAAAAAVGDAAPRAAPIDDSNVSVKRAFVSHTESVEVRDWKSGAAAAKRKRDEAPTAAAAAADARANEKRARAVSQANRDALQIVRAPVYVEYVEIEESNDAPPPRAAADDDAAAILSALRK